MASALGAFAVTAMAAAANMMSVQVRKADLRATPSFLGAVTASLQYGERVAVDQQNGPWYRVTQAGGTASGWLHNSALSRKTIVMSAGGAAQTGASSGEMALAGKGFNADIEKEFKANHKNIDFTSVDRMETRKVAVSAVQAFAREGGLETKGGAQ